MKQKGQLIITDLILYIIILTIITGLVVFMITQINHKDAEKLNNQELDLIAEDIMDQLTQTEGNPDDWHETTKIITIGLYDEKSGKISSQKLEKLKNNPELLDKLILYDVNYELTIAPADNRNNKTIIAKRHKSTNNTSIYTKEKIIQQDHDLNITPITQEDLICPLNHTINYTCMPIKLNNQDNTKYYIISENTAHLIITNTYMQNIELNTGCVCEITNSVEQLNYNNTTLYLHTNMNDSMMYLVLTNSTSPTVEMLNQNYVLSLKIY